MVIYYILYIIIHDSTAKMNLLKILWICLCIASACGHAQAGADRGIYHGKFERIQPASFIKYGK